MREKAITLGLEFFQSSQNPQFKHKWPRETKRLRYGKVCTLRTIPAKQTGKRYRMIGGGKMWRTKENEQLPAFHPGLSLLNGFSPHSCTALPSASNLRFACLGHRLATTACCLFLYRPQAKNVFLRHFRVKNGRIFQRYENYMNSKFGDHKQSFIAT